MRSLRSSRPPSHESPDVSHCADSTSVREVENMTETSKIVVIPTPPPPSSESARAVMIGNRKRDTRPERALRSALHARGLRYRIDYKIGKGRTAPRPDVCFTRARVAVFVDGCFWHGCPRHGIQPKTNSHYWRAKLGRNRVRDAANNAALETEGWRVIRVWEHEDPHEAAAMIELAVLTRPNARSPQRQVAARSASA
jgi:DNA mismatch endonuclease (patch repair protein)